MRGGTSRAVCFREDVLAEYSRESMERIVLAALGSPDGYGRQVDGLGGGISSLSKVMIVGKSDRVDTDVTFTFGQVDVTTPTIDWNGTCGNMSAAVGPFAIDEGMINAVDPVTSVRVFAANTGQRYIARVPVRNGEAQVEGDYSIDGVPSPGACIELEYLRPGGSLNGSLLPTGLAREVYELDNSQTVTVSVVDAAIPTVFVRASQLGVDIRKLPQELDAETGVHSVLEKVRCRASVRLGIASNYEEAHTKFLHTPKVALVGSSCTYRGTDGRAIDAGQMDFLVRAISMRRTHRTIPGTVSICAAVAAEIADTVVGEVAKTRRSKTVRIGHPAGVMELRVTGAVRNRQWSPTSVTTYRTARRIMEGSVFVPVGYLQNAIPWYGRK